MSQKGLYLSCPDGAHDRVNESNNSNDDFVLHHARDVTIFPLPRPSVEDVQVKSNK